MRTEDDIRQHIADLQACLAAPCSCTGAEHELSCFCGACMIEANICLLKWVLGDRKHDELHAYLHRRAEQHRAESN